MGAAREWLAAWEQAAGALSQTMVRDPRTLALGGDVLRVGLLWKKAIDETIALSMSAMVPTSPEQHG